MTVTVLHSFPVWLPQTQTWMYNQVRYLPPDIEAHIVCERTENLDQFGLPNIHCRADRPVWWRYWHKGLRKLRMRRPSDFAVGVARQQRASILHSHFGNIGWMDMEIARLAGLRHVVSFYGVDVNFLPRHEPVWRRRYGDLFEHVDTVLCEGEHMAGNIVALGCPEQKVKVQRLGIALEDIPFAPCEWRPGTPLRVLIAASFREKKGIPDALAALGRLKAKTPFEATLIGDAGDDPRSWDEKREILAALDRHGLADAVRILGYQPHSRLLEEARQHHIFLSPSLTARDGDTEGGAPVSLIEMAASGMMIVSTTHCDIPEIIKHGQTGLLAEERDVDGLVANMIWLLDNPGRWNDMQHAARRHVENKFDAYIQGEKLAAIYRELMAQGR